MKPVSSQTSADRPEAACGPLLKFSVCGAVLGRRGKGAPGQATALRLGGRCCAPTPLRPWRLQAPGRAPGTEQSAGDCSVSGRTASVSWPRRRTHFAPCGRCVQTTATSQKTMRAARAATSPGLAGRAGPGGPAVRKAQAVPRTACVPAHLLGASEARLRLPGRAFAEPVVVCATRNATGGLRGRRCPLGAISGATRSAAPGSARVSALRELTCRGCLNAATAGREVSSAARPRREHRSAVGLQGRPPQHEPPAGSACRDARTSHESRHPQTSAKGRKPPPDARGFMRRGSCEARWSS